MSTPIITARSTEQPSSHQVARFLAAHNPEIAVECGRQFIEVNVVAPDAQMLLRNCEPIRPQLVKELRRVAELYRYIAGSIEDTEYCEAEDRLENEQYLQLFTSRAAVA